MRIYEKLLQYNIKPRYIRKNVDCFLDPYREIFVEATPEEYVRQQIIKFLTDELNIPIEMINTEVILKHYGINSTKRIDIAINKRDKDGNLYVIGLVECKSNDIPLTQKVYDQATEYADLLCVNYVFITNGIDVVALHYNEQEERYYTLNHIPSYEDMINDKELSNQYQEQWDLERIPLKELLENDKLEDIDEFGMIGEDTPQAYKPFILNLGQCFLDCSKILKKKKYDDITIVEDYGIRYMYYGNPSGGGYDTLYRTIIIEDEYGNNQMISFCVVACMKCVNHPIWGNATGKSVLVVAIDDFDKSHNSLQLNLNKFINMNGDTITLKHNGAIAIGNVGSSKISEVKKFIKNKYPSLINDKDEIVLGKLKNNKDLYIDDKEVEYLIINLIRYALVRDEYRDYVKSLKRK